MRAMATRNKKLKSGFYFPRLPIELANRLEDEAKRNKRTLPAEIVIRLEQSLQPNEDHRNSPLRRR